ncbi:hypothetical protein L484_002997 [Morus notabilis]|uniref:Uncharacterized protein n=1 Tax=Morus notabilis TaxID=981085 RepID=W9R886_9ROSA|nr:hypothetical protein L484_002997 [Morus notabilis]
MGHDNFWQFECGDDTETPPLSANAWRVARPGRHVIKHVASASIEMIHIILHLTCMNFKGPGAMLGCRKQVQKIGCNMPSRTPLKFSSPAIKVALKKSVHTAEERRRCLS